MKYLSNRLADFDETCIAMHIMSFQPDRQLKIKKFENPRLQTAAILKIEKKHGIWYVRC